MKLIRHGDSRLTAGNIEWRTQTDLQGILRCAEKAQAWRIGSRYTAVRLPSGVVFRRLFEPAKKLEELVADLLAKEMDHSISSWGGVWRHWNVFPSRTPAFAAEAFEATGGGRPDITDEREPEYPWSGFYDGFGIARDAWVGTPHAWIEQREAGARTGAWTEWDLRSAYSWASLAGLPDLASLRVLPPDGKTISDSAVYLVDGIESEWRDVEKHLLPTWLRPKQIFRGPVGDLFHDRSAGDRDWHVWVPGETLNRLCLSPKRVLLAFEWERSKDFRKVFCDIREHLPRWWRNVYRSHWGDWGAKESAQRESWIDGRIATHNPMPDGLRAPLWSWLVMARVADRMSPFAEHAARIFTDSVVLPDEFGMPDNVGDEIGQWQVKTRWADGVEIQNLPNRPRGVEHALKVGAIRVENRREREAREEQHLAPGWLPVRL